MTVLAYDAHLHAVESFIVPNAVERLAVACKDDNLLDASARLVFVGNTEKLSSRYRQRAERYLWIEVGHAAQNVLLQATELGLGARPIGAFSDAQARRVLDPAMKPDERVLYIVLVGAKDG